MLQHRCLVSCCLDSIFSCAHYLTQAFGFDVIWKQLKSNSCLRVSAMVVSEPSDGDCNSCATFTAVTLSITAFTWLPLLLACCTGLKSTSYFGVFAMVVSRLQCDWCAVTVLLTQQLHSPSLLSVVAIVAGMLNRLDINSCRVAFPLQTSPIVRSSSPAEPISCMGHGSAAMQAFALQRSFIWST